MKTRTCKAYLALLLALCLALPAGMPALAEDPVSDEPLEVIAVGTEESKQAGAVEVNNESPAVLAKASEGGTATAEAGSVTVNAPHAVGVKAESEDTGSQAKASAADVTANETPATRATSGGESGAEAVVAVAENGGKAEAEAVSAKADAGEGNAIAVTSSAEGEGSESKVTVTKDAVAVSNEGSAAAVSVETDDQGKAEVSVGGAAKATGANDAYGVTAHAEGGSQITAKVGGDVEAKGEEGYGVYVLYADDEGTKVQVTVGGNVTVEGTSYAVGVEAMPWQGSASVSVTGNVTATATEKEGEYPYSSATALDIESNYGAETKAAVGGDAVAKAGDSATAVDALGGSGTAKTTVTVTGEAAAESEGDAYGVKAMGNDGTADVTVKGGVSAQGAGKDVYGVNAESKNDGVTAVTVTGGVTADAAGAALSGNGTRTLAAAADLENEEDGESGDAGKDEDELGVAVAVAQGVYAYANSDGKTTVTVTGDVTATAAGSGASVSGTGSAVLFAAADVENEGDGTKEEEEPSSGDTSMTFAVAQGVNASAGSAGSAAVTVTGDVTAVSDLMAAGVYASVVGEGQATVTVVGDVAANTADTEYGEAYGIATQSSGGEIVVDVTGDVTGDTAGIGIENHSSGGGATEVKVVGDVTGGQFGLGVMSDSEKATVNAVIDGTLSGKEAGVVLSADTNTENVNLTVWKVDLNEDGDAAVQANADTGKFEKAEEFEKAIMYIIRLQQPKKGGTLSTGGTTKSNDYDTAHEGDTVTLKVNVKKGYKVVAAYNGTDQKVQLVQDAKGDYYIVVPKGGGVTLSVALKLVPQNYTPQKKATVSVYTDGGKVPGRKAGDFTISTYVGKKLNAPKKPVKDGFKFLGWFQSETETAFDYENMDPAEADLLKAGKPFKVEGNVNLIAVWQQE